MFEWSRLCEKETDISFKPTAIFAQKLLFPNMIFLYLRSAKLKQSFQISFLKHFLKSDDASNKSSV